MTDAFTLHHGDCLDVLRAAPSGSVDAIVTDPPYGLTQDKKGGSGEASVNLNTPHGRARVTTGFMGMAWDGAVPPVEIWAECLRVLKPGGHLLAFGGSRTYHRLAVNVEDAGFEIRDQVMWVYGSGFPKSHNISKAIDKAAGAEREVTGSRVADNITGGNMHAANRGERHVIEIKDKPATPEAQQWDGWGSALKPAHEPVVLARKPLGEKTLAANVLEHGTGGLNIDGCRIGSDDAPAGRKRHGGGIAENHSSFVLPDSDHQSPAGRFPANLIHDGSDEVVELFPGAGEKSAARFFYCAKASKSDRDEGNKHPTVKPTDLMAYLCRLVTPPGGVVLDPFLGSGSTGKAAIREGFKFIGIEREAEYIAIARARIEAAHD